MWLERSGTARVIKGFDKPRGLILLVGRENVTLFFFF